MVFDASVVENIIGYTFNDKSLLKQAFTHSSYAHEHNQKDNELLEFFGDSILEFFVTEWLYHNEGGDEGLLTKFRAEMVAKDPLNKALHDLNLDEYILLGAGQRKSVCEDEKFFSSVFEALVAAIYLDGGTLPTKKFVLDTLVRNFLKDKKRIKASSGDGQAKTLFQEYVQKHKLGKIEYQLIDKKGPDHRLEFCVALSLNGKILASGKGYSKKSAESMAAKKALDKLKDNKDGILN